MRKGDILVSRVEYKFWSSVGTLARRLCGDLTRSVLLSRYVGETLSLSYAHISLKHMLRATLTAKKSVYFTTFRHPGLTGWTRAMNVIKKELINHLLNRTQSDLKFYTWVGRWI